MLNPIRLKTKVQALSRNFHVRFRSDTGLQPQSLLKLLATIPVTALFATSLFLGTAQPANAQHGHGEPNTHQGNDRRGNGWVRVGDENVTFRRGSIATTYNVRQSNSLIPGWLTICDSSHKAPVDPIVFPGVVGQSHLHEFFGNPTVNENTSTQSLLNGRTNCYDPNDLSAYWVPTAYQNGRLLTSSRFSVYYRRHRGGRTMPMPIGLRMIAGDAHTNNSNSTSENVYWEGNGDTKGSRRMIRADSKGMVQMRVHFPDCWDGEHLDSPDHASHVAYGDRHGNCPSSHPVPIPVVRARVVYETRGGSGFSLSSGEWFTAHMDFWNAWHPGKMEALVSRCTNRNTLCTPGGRNRVTIR